MCGMGGRRGRKAAGKGGLTVSDVSPDTGWVSTSSFSPPFVTCENFRFSDINTAGRSKACEKNGNESDGTCEGNGQPGYVGTQPTKPKLPDVGMWRVARKG